VFLLYNNSLSLGECIPNTKKGANESFFIIIIGERLVRDMVRIGRILLANMVGKYNK